MNATVLDLPSVDCNENIVIKNVSLQNLSAHLDISSSMSIYITDVNESGERARVRDSATKHGQRMGAPQIHIPQRM